MTQTDPYVLILNDAQHPGTLLNTVEELAGTLELTEVERDFVATALAERRREERDRHGQHVRPGMSCPR